MSKTKVDLDSVLASAAVETNGKKGAPKVPVIQVSAKIMELVTRKQSLVKRIEALVSEDEIVSADIVTGIQPIYEERCAKDFSSSVKVPAEDGSTITVSWKSAYSKVPATEEAGIKALVGENYDRWFTKVNTVTVADTSPEFLKKLIGLVGAENFKNFFSVEQAISPNATFTEEKYSKLSASQRATIGAVVKQYKPSIRTK